MNNPKFILPLMAYCFSFALNGFTQQNNYKEVEQLYYNFINNNSNDGTYQHFKRWQFFTEQRSYPTGNYYSPDILFNEYQKIKNSETYKNQNVCSGKWNFIGPGNLPANGGGSGRINCIAFDPVNANIIWIGAACGGLWKSTNSGQTWDAAGTDFLPSISISDIAIDSLDPKVMYIATGDKYGILPNFFTWGQYAAGVLKSTDGGNTWMQTGLNFQLDAKLFIQRLILDHKNSKILYAATSTGVYKSTDAGINWLKIKTGKFYDLEMHPSNNLILYTADSTKTYLTTDGGNSWTNIGITAKDRSSIAVSKKNPNSVYIWADGALYYSNNSGTGFSIRSNPGNTCNALGYYDLVLEVSPLDDQVLLAGGVEVAMSTDGGNNWTKVSNSLGFPSGNYVHADQKAFLFKPNSKTEVYLCNDGGVFYSANQCSSFVDKSNGIDIKQYYRIASSFQNPSVIFGGSQDNGSDKITGPTSSSMVYGMDGMDCLVDYTNDNIVFVSTQGGSFKRSTNGGSGFTNVPATGCYWVSPITMDPNNNNIIYIGSVSLHKSVNNGLSWTTLPLSFDGKCVYSVEVAKSNSNYLYAATFAHIYRSVNGGANWNDLTNGLPVANAAITGIAVSSTNPDKFWVCFSGFSANNKIFLTTDGGNSWTNVSTGLPNVPVNCIEYQNGSNDIVYVGTDLGVYYKDATMSNWMPFNNGLPNVIIDDLEMYYPNGTVRAGTYGRGVWESKFATAGMQTLDAAIQSVDNPVTGKCDTTFTPQITLKNNGTNTLTTCLINYSFNNQPYSIYSWNGTLNSNNNTTIQLSNQNLSPGTHSLKVYCSNPNNNTDLNNWNDTLQLSFVIHKTKPILSPLVEDFESMLFPPQNWITENSSGIWSPVSVAGGFGTSSKSAKASILNVTSAKGSFTSPYIDFKKLFPPISLSFDVAYAQYLSSDNDSLSVQLYDICNDTGIVIYIKSGNSLKTASPVTISFVPKSNEWRKEIINLDTLSGKSAYQLKFTVFGNNGNNLYIDNINLNASLTGTANITQHYNWKIFPSPAKDYIFYYCEDQKQITTLLVKDVTGKITARFDGIENGAKLDISGIAAGMYFVEVIGKTKSEVQKIIVK